MSYFPLMCRNGINQYKHITFNIFSCRILIISYKILIITVTSNEKTINEKTSNETSHYFTDKSYSFFISSAGKIERVQEFRMKLCE